MPDRFTDILTYALSLALAAGVIAFATYKVVALDGMADPPANLGLNFPAAKRKVIMQEAPSDPLTTRSLGPAARPGAAGEPGGPYAYELLAVVDGVGFVAVDSDSGKTLVPVTIGSRLPGGLKVTALSRVDGRWWLVAGDLTLRQRRVDDQ